MRRLERSLMSTEKILQFLIYIPGFLFSLSFHEMAHAYVAARLGDDTAKRLGRVSLNPLAHADPVGTFLMPFLGFMTGIPVLAWAKPVPFNPLNLKNRRRDSMWISLAGPVSNLFLAFVFAGIIHGVYYAYPFLRGYIPSHFFGIFYVALQITFLLNIGLFVFNFLPIDPLDGGKIIRGILPENLARSFDFWMDRYGRILGIVFLILIFTGGLGRVISVPIVFIGRLLLGDKFIF